MKSFQVILLTSILILPISFSSTFSYGIPDLSQAGNVALWVTLRLRDYETDMPISNTSITANISTSWGQKRVGPVLTNETGIVKVFLGNFTKPTSVTPPNLLGIKISNNYTLIKVQDLLMEDTSYTGQYVPNLTTYTGLQMSLFQRNLTNQIDIEGNLWVLKGKPIRISDSDPVTGAKMTSFLSVKPAVRAVLSGVISEYESYYFFPLNYKIIIRAQITTISASYTMQLYPPLEVKVDENTALINWVYHVAKAYVDQKISSMDKEFELLKSSGQSLDREIEEYQAIKSLLNRVLDLYQKEEYGPAQGGAMLSANKLSSLNKWFSDLKNLAKVTTIAIFLFIYGLASLLSSFIFEEPAEKKIRLATKVLIFCLFALMFSLTYPSLKISYALIIGSRYIDVPLSLLGCFIAGSITYFFFALISIKKAPMTDLALQLGVRSLKRRQSRTILTLITITIIVSSAIVFVNISMSRASRVKDSWKGTSTSGVLVKPDIRIAPLSEYDVNWTRTQDWCEDLGYTEEIRDQEPSGENTLVRFGILQLGEQEITVDIVGIDPAFMERYYNLPEYVRGFWQDLSEGKAVAILPSTYKVPTNAYVTLAVTEYIVTAMGGMIPLGTRKLGEFRVVGIFDPLIFSNLTKIDNTPLFQNPSTLVLVPLKAIIDPSIVISEVTVLMKEGFNPVSVAEELAYMFGVPTVANKDEVALRIEWSLELSIAGLIPYLPPLAIASLMMYITMFSVYEERRREFVTLATLGLDPKSTFQVFLYEALLLGLMGTFFGFFGSYILAIALFYLTNFLGMSLISALSFLYMQWSMPAILVAFFTGVVMVFLGGYIPAVKTQGLSLMGRVKKRRLVGELVSEGSITSFTLPIRENVQNGEMLYTYVRETVGKIKRPPVDPHSVKGEIYRDGSSKVSFIVIGSGGSVFIPYEVKGVREGEILVPVIEFPTNFKEYEQTRDILRDLEGYMIGFSTWKEMQLKMQIVRESPKKEKTIEEIMTEIQDVIAQIKDCNKKLKILETQKSKLSEAIYNEFRQKYINIIEEKSKSLRAVAIGLEPYSNQLQEEIKKSNVEIERITTAYSLGEITEEDYVRNCGPLQGRVAVLKNKVKELEEIFEFLKKPLGMLT